MVKTHQYSRFALKDLNGIRDSSDVILQIDKTESNFKDSNSTVYLCEVVSAASYRAAPTVERLTDEIVKLNEENRRKQKKIDKLEKLLLATKRD